MKQIKFLPVRGIAGTKEAKVTPTDTRLKVAAVNGLKHIEGFLQQIHPGESRDHLIEVMACPNGCMNDGGQPITAGPDKIRRRMDLLYQMDRLLTECRSHHDESVHCLYDEFLGAPNSHLAHELLCTHDIERERL